MRNLSLAIERLKKQLRQESLRAVIVRHCDCTEIELYFALTSLMEFAGRTDEELKYFARHGHFPGEHQRDSFQSLWDAEARNEQIKPSSGLRMIGDVYPEVDPATLDTELRAAKQLRGKGVDELKFIAFHGRDPESVAELASFVAGPPYRKPAECEICHPRRPVGGPE